VKKKVVLVVPQSVWISKDHLPSIGLAYIAAGLEKDGYDVIILDCQAQCYSAIDAAEKIADLNPDAVGLTATSHNRFWVLELAQEIKKRRELFLFAGGIHFGLTGVDALQNVAEIDVIVNGEGEETTRELLNAHFNATNLKTVPGIVYRDSNEHIVKNKDRPFINDLNRLPDPAWHFYEMDKYSAQLEGFKGSENRTIGVMSSRGCPFGCSFCANEAFWRRKLRRLHPEKFVDQLAYLQKQYGFRNFNFWDDTFTVVESHAFEVCEQILKRGLDIKVYLRARIGGVAIGYGIETGSQRVLDAISKGITVSQAKLTVKMSLDLGFFVKAFFMTSLPGETLDDVEMTMDLVDELKDYGGDRIQVGYGFPTTIYPGTKIELIAKETGILPEKFSWNSEFESQTSKDLGLNPTIPCFENPYLSLKKILDFRRSREHRAKGSKISRLLRSLPTKLKQMISP